MNQYIEGNNKDHWLFHLEVPATHILQAKHQKGKHKGLDNLLKTLNLVKKKVPNVVLIIAGQTLGFMESWDRYERIIKGNNLENYVIKRLEYIPESEVEIYFSAADVIAIISA